MEAVSHLLLLSRDTKVLLDFFQKIADSKGTWSRLPARSVPYCVPLAHGTLWPLSAESGTPYASKTQEGVENCPVDSFPGETHVWGFPFKDFCLRILTAMQIF